MTVKAFTACATSGSASSSKMAPPKKKRKISKRERKKVLQEKSRKALEKRGIGAGSRQKFTLPAKWTKEQYESGDRTRVTFVSPGKTKYNTQKKVSETLAARNLMDCFHDKSTTEEEEENTEGSEFNPSDDEKKPEPSCKRIGVAVERRFFVCESTQLMDMVEQINSTSRCSTPDCNG